MKPTQAVHRFLPAIALAVALPLFTRPALGGFAAGVSAPPGARAAAGQPDSPRPGEDYVAGEVLVTFKPVAAGVKRENLVRAMGDRVAAGLENRPDMAKVRVESGRSVNEAVQAYEADPGVEHAQPNYIYRAQKTPDDTFYDLLWGLENTGQQVNGTYGTSGKDIGAPSAWDSQTDCTGVSVAVLDTGINYEHADLAGNMWDGDTNHGKDFVGTNDPDPIPDGGHYHGTHVAGTIAAIGNNATGTTGICWQAEIMAVRVLDAGARGTTADITEGVEYAVNNGAKVINMSLVGVADDPALKDALASARDQGIIVVAAAGNSGADNDASPLYPCSFSHDNIICVAALDQDYALASFSNYGSTSVDIGAPGVNVLSHFPGSIDAADYSTWTLYASWAMDTCGTNTDYLINPTDWCSLESYSNSLDGRAYQTYDLSNSDLLGAGFHYAADYNLNDQGDFFTEGHFAGEGDPFANSPTVDLKVEGAIDTGGFKAFSINVSDCLGSKCSIGFQLDTDSSGTGEGVAVKDIALHKVTSGATNERYMYGTSMAAPHVAGIVALARAYSNGSSYSTIRDAVLQGGDAADSLDAKTVTGKAVDAAGTLDSLNGAPSVADESLTTQKDTEGSVTLSGSDPEGDTLTWSVSSTPANGSASVDDSGKATYTPDSGHTGSDSFTVQVADTNSNTDTATVSVTVEDPNEAPSVSDTTLTTQEDTEATVTLSASDPEGDSLTWSISTTPEHGGASVDDTGEASYTPNAGYTGDDSFTVKVSDGNGNSDTAKVAVTVEAAAGGGGGGGCTLAGRSGQPDPVWALLLLAPWLLRRQAARRAA